MIRLIYTIYINVTVYKHVQKARYKKTPICTMLLGIICKRWRLPFKDLKPCLRRYKNVHKDKI